MQYFYRLIASMIFLSASPAWAQDNSVNIQELPQQYAPRPDAKSDASVPIEEGASNNAPKDHQAEVLSNPMMSDYARAQSIINSNNTSDGTAGMTGQDKNAQMGSALSQSLQNDLKAKAKKNNQYNNTIDTDGDAGGN